MSSRARTARRRGPRHEDVGADEHDDGVEEPESIHQAVTHSLDEARMVLPGIQTLFGFQLVAVFNARFEDDLSIAEQRMHLVALLLVGVAVGLIMTPAAYHRQAEHDHSSRHLLTVVSVLVSVALVPLMLGLSIDVYLVARLVTHDESASAWVAGALLALLAALWFGYPRVRRARVRR